MARRKKTPKKPHRSGFLFMILVLLILGLFLFIYKDKFAVLVDTGLNSGKNIFTKAPSNNNKSNDSIFDKIKFLDLKKQKQTDKNTPDNNSNKEVIVLKKNPKTKPEPPTPQPIKKVTKIKKETSKTVQTTTQKPKNTTPEKVTYNKHEKSQPVTEKKAPVKTKKVAVQKPETKKTEKKPSNISSKIYFTRIDNNNNLQLISKNIKVRRTLPLTDTITQLLKGPTSYDNDQEIVSTIPYGTKLLTINIKNNIAYINFSKEFEFNKYGRESTSNQLKQIVFTATEFPNIKGVQFLIEGKIKTYLGGEGIIINKPLTRNDFS